MKAANQIITFSCKYFGTKGKLFFIYLEKGEGVRLSWKGNEIPLPEPKAFPGLYEAFEFIFITLREMEIKSEAYPGLENLEVNQYIFEDFLDEIFEAVSKDVTRIHVRGHRSKYRTDAEKNGDDDAEYESKTNGLDYFILFERVLKKEV